MPIDRWVDRDDLEEHLRALPDQPDAISYVTSYYRKTERFCITHEQRARLGDRPFRVVINSTLKPGHLTYADAVLPGVVRHEVSLARGMGPPGGVFCQEDGTSWLPVMGPLALLPVA